MTLELKVRGEFSEAFMKPWETSSPLSSGNGISPAAHFSAGTIDEACQLLCGYRDKRARIIAGGVDILRTIRRNNISELPGALVNLKTVPGLSFIKEENGYLRIGALTTLSEIESSELVKAKCGVLADTAGLVGSPQVRNMATIAGNLCQDVTCWYYRAEKDYFHCLRKGGSLCPAQTGDNRWMFGIFSPPDGCGCHATCQSDMSITLSALGASIKTTRRLIPVDDFHTSAGNVLGPDEIITEVLVSLTSGISAKYTKFSIRKSIDHPLVSVACVVKGGEVKVVIGGVSLAPYIACKVNDLLCDKELTGELAERAGTIAVEGAAPLSMNRWKVEVTRALVKRTLLDFAFGENR